MKLYLKIFKKPKFLIPSIIILVILISGIITFNNINFSSANKEVAGVSEEKSSDSSSLTIFGKSELENSDSLENSQYDNEDKVKNSSSSSENSDTASQFGQNNPTNPGKKEDGKKDSNPVQIPDYNKVRQYSLICSDSNCEVIDEFTERLVGSFIAFDYANYKPFFTSNDVLVDAVCTFDSCNLKIFIIENAKLQILYEGYFNPRIEIVENPIFEISKSGECQNPTSPEMFWEKCVLNKDINAQKAKEIKEFFERWKNLGI